VALLRSAISISRLPHASIEVIAFDERGHRMGSTDFLRTWRPTLIIRDHTGAVCFGLQYGLGTPRLAIPAAEPVSFELPWTVPGFGKVLLRADNRGHGYRVSAGAYTRIELLPELTRSRLLEVERWITAHNQGRAATDEVAQALAFVRRQIARLDAAANSEERASLAIPALRAALRAGEQEVLAEASNSASEHRSGKLLIKVIDRHGAPLPDIRISIAEARPEFLFGVGIQDGGYDPETLTRVQQLGLNYAGLDINWRRLEPRNNVYAFDEFDRRFNPAGLRQPGFTLRARTPVSPLDPALPPYVEPMRGKTKPLGLALRTHLAPIVRHYKDLIDIWQIDEDPAIWASFDLNEAGATEAIKAVAEAIRKDAPNARIMLNVAAPLGEDVAAGHYPRLIGNSRVASPAAADPYTRLENLSHAGVPYDLIGLEFNYGGSVEYAASRLRPPTIDLFRFARELERYAKLGKPLQITEFAVASSGRGEGWWHAPADEGTQADYLAAALTLAYANPQVQAISWSAIHDSRSVAGRAGLIDSAGRPKPAYDRIRSLLTGWRTEGEVTTGPDGTASFQGAAGNYQLSVQVAKTAIAGVAHIHPNGTDVAIMSLPVKAAPAPPLPAPAVNEDAPLENPEVPEVPEAPEPFEPPSP